MGKPKKIIKNVVVNSLEGKPLRLAVYGDDGDPQRDDEGNLIREDATLAKCLKQMVRFFPRELMTMQNVIDGGRLFRIVQEAGDEIVMKESTYDWALKMLKHDKVGVALFAMSVPNVIAALKGEAETVTDAPESAEEDEEED